MLICDYCNTDIDTSSSPTSTVPIQPNTTEPAKTLHFHPECLEEFGEEIKKVKGNRPNKG